LSDLEQWLVGGSHQVSDSWEGCGDVRRVLTSFRIVSFLLLFEFLIQDRKYLMRDLLPSSHTEQVFPEDITTFFEHTQGKSVQKLGAVISVKYKSYRREGLGELRKLTLIVPILLVVRFFGLNEFIFAMF
jgi:hypothetical protein